MDNQQGKTTSEMLELTAYSFGAFLGDGSLSYNYHGNGGWYVVFLGCMDLEIIERFRDEICRAFGKSYYIHHRTLKSGTPFHQLSTSRKDIFDYFSINTYFKHIIPERIYDARDSIKRDFLAGLFDTDGTVAKSKIPSGYRYLVRFANNKPHLIAGAYRLLKSLGVKIGKIHENHKEGYATTYYIQPNMRSFIDAGCYFHVGRKQKRLHEYLSLFASETMHTEPITMG